MLALIYINATIVANNLVEGGFRTITIFDTATVSEEKPLLLMDT
jgi:hypothetical protein